MTRADELRYLLVELAVCGERSAERTPDGSWRDIRHCPSCRRKVERFAELDPQKHAPDCGLIELAVLARQRYESPTTAKDDR